MSLPRLSLAVCLTAIVASLGWLSQTRAETVQHGNLRVSFTAKLAPHALPRAGTAPIAVTVGGRISTTDNTTPPQLQGIDISINRLGRLDPTGLPTCRLEQIQPATTANALKACGAAKVGEGSFSADVVIPEQSPFPSAGRLVAFNGVIHGKPVILAHVYGTAPVPTSFTLTLSISHQKGVFGTRLRASLPKVASDVAFITSISLTLDRRFAYRGKRRSYLSAGCPAPKGFPGGIFPLLRASFAFSGGEKLTSTAVRSCAVRR